MTMLSTLAAAATDRNFRFNLPGTVPDLLFCDGKCPNAKELDTNSGGGKWMYDQTARSFGFDPKTARQSLDQDAKVMARLGETINHLIAQTKSGGAPSLASQHSDFRSALTQITRTEDAKIKGALTPQHLATLAALPGAATLSDPAMRGAVQAAVTVEQRLLTVAAPPLGEAAKAGSALGVVATVALAEALSPDVPLGPQAKPVDAAQADDSSKPTALNPAALALDANKDGKLECKEIGNWVVDTGRHSANSRAYQDYVTGKAGYVFHVEVTFKSASVKFDGCKDEAAGPLLLEAKGDHGNVLDPMGFDGAQVAIVRQAKFQNEVAVNLGVRNEEHVQTEKDTVAIRSLFDFNGIPTPVVYDPMSKAF